MTTPLSGRYSRDRTATMSPPLSGSTVGVHGGSSLKEVRVNRVVIEGKAKRGKDGASIKMYLKMQVPVDHIAPGSTVPLFAEENVKVLTSEVHPIDANSIPYAFSSTSSPSLHNAARALNLPERSTQSYLFLFGIPATSSMVRASSSSSRIPTSSNHNHNHGGHTPKLDERYTGHIVVSGYNISYVLPKEFPEPSAVSLTNGNGRSTPHRRGSVIEKGIQQHFMAAINLWIPFASRPPRAPYLLSIPTPRCLSNHIKLKIFPPPPSSSSQQLPSQIPSRSTSASFHSLSSAGEEDDQPPLPTWELASEPHVSRASSRQSSASAASTSASYADDEDSSGGSISTSANVDNACGLHGTFPSTERLLVRWATPQRPTFHSNAHPVDNIGRVGVKRVSGNMECTVLGPYPSATSPSGSANGGGVLMRLEYKATCTGVWFPGVASMVGMDVGLVSKGSEVTWAPEVVTGEGEGWRVSGGTGFVGFDDAEFGDGEDEEDAEAELNHQSSFDTPQGAFSSRSLPPSRPSSAIPTRHSSTSSQASLIRASLPATHTVSDYSFETTGATAYQDVGASTSTISASGTGISSLSSLPPTTPETISRQPSFKSTPHRGSERGIRPPSDPFTILLNMNSLLPHLSQKTPFSFTVSGVVVIAPRSGKVQGSSTTDEEGFISAAAGERQTVVQLPQFGVLASDNEDVQTTIRMDANANAENSTSLEVLLPSGDVREGQTRRTVLKPGQSTRCGSDGGRIGLKQQVVVKREGMDRHAVAGGGSRTPMEGTQTPSNSKPKPGRLRTTSAGSALSRMPSSVPFVTSSSMRGRKRDGILMIPYVNVSVTPLLKTQEKETLPSMYAVKVALPCPCESGTEWLEFGLARPESSSSSVGGSEVKVISASVAGVPVLFEALSSASKERRGFGGGSISELGLNVANIGSTTASSEWASWIRARVGEVGGEDVVVEYVVSYPDDGVAGESSKKRGKRKAGSGRDLELLLPSFALPVGRLEVDITPPTGVLVTSLRSNLPHQAGSGTPYYILGFALEELFRPQALIRVDIGTSWTSGSLLPLLQALLMLTGVFLSCFLILALSNVGDELHLIKKVVEDRAAIDGSTIKWDHEPITVMVTTTVRAPLEQSTKRWFGDSSSVLPPVMTDTPPASPVAPPLPEATPQMFAGESKPTPRPSYDKMLKETETSLLPWDNRALFWKQVFDFDIPDYRALFTYGALMGGLGRLWGVVGKVWHFPAGQ